MSKPLIITGSACSRINNRILGTSFIEPEYRRRLYSYPLFQVCGEVCYTKDPVPPAPKSTYYAQLRKHFDCPSLLKERVHDIPSPPMLKKPCERIPDFLRDDFLYNGRVKEDKWFLPGEYDHLSKCHSFSSFSSKATTKVV